MVSLNYASLSPPEFHTHEDHKIIRDETFNIMIAGRDTVRSSRPIVSNLADRSPS